jgi:hypothetical protein
MRKLDRDIKEIRDFLSGIRFDDAGFSEQHRTTIAAAYKQFHAVLIWHLVIEKTYAKGSPVKVYYSECVSDISHCFLFTLMHLYKPARMVLRSSIENLLRTLLFIKGVDAAKITVVYELFAATKSAFSGHATMVAVLKRLDSVYADLCKTVHSAKVDYMSLSVPFEQLFVFNSTRYAANLAAIQSVASVANRTMFLILHDALKTAGHHNEDFVRDSVPRALKREVSS